MENSGCVLESSSGFLWSVIVRFAHSASKFGRKFIVTLLAGRFQIDFIEFSFLIHFLVTNGTREMMNAPGFIQSREHCEC